MVHHDVDDRVFRLHAAVDDPGAGVAGDFSVSLPCLLVHDEIDRTGFVFDRDERNPLRRPRSLADEHQARDFHPAVVRQGRQLVRGSDAQRNELGEASHAAYKDRQRQAVMRRLKVGSEQRQNQKKDR